MRKFLTAALGLLHLNIRRRPGSQDLSRRRGRLRAATTSVIRSGERVARHPRAHHGRGRGSWKTASSTSEPFPPRNQPELLRIRGARVGTAQSNLPHNLFTRSEACTSTRSSARPTACSSRRRIYPSTVRSRLPDRRRPTWRARPGADPRVLQPHPGGLRRAPLLRRVAARAWRSGLTSTRWSTEDDDCDGRWSTIGTANTIAAMRQPRGIRSSSLPPLAARMETFRERPETARRLTIDEWEKRSTLTRIGEVPLGPLRALV